MENVKIVFRFLVSETFVFRFCVSEISKSIVSSVIARSLISDLDFRKSCFDDDVRNFPIDSEFRKLSMPKAQASDGILFLAFHGLGFRVKGGGGVWGGALTPIIFLFKLFSSAIVSDPGQGHEVPKVRCDATGYGDKVLNAYNVYNVNNVLVPGEGHGLMH